MVGVLVGRRGCHQGGVADRINETTLLRVAVCQPRKPPAPLVIDDVDASQIEHVEGDLNVTQNRTTSYEARSLRSDQRNSRLNVVAIVFVRETQFAHLAVSNRESETLTRRGGTVPRTLRSIRGAL